MKKHIYTLLLLCLICALVIGCDNNPQTKESPATKIEDVAATETAGVDLPASDDTPEIAEAVDVDLSAMNNTIMLAKVNDMFTKPQEYLGKTVRARGIYLSIYDEENDTLLHFLSVGAKDACCGEWLRFVLNGDYTYPDDYPQENTWAEIRGVYTFQEELDKRFYLTVDALNP